MIALQVADRTGVEWAQCQVIEHHYLRAPVDPRCRPLVYVVCWQPDGFDQLPPNFGLVGSYRVGCLIFGRPESTRCYAGGLTYGSLADVQTGRARFDRWEILNLARVWLDPAVQAGGALYSPDYLSGYVDRRGLWQSTLASTVISQALARVGYDYLVAHPPVDCSYPYAIRAVLSYCDWRLHRGTIYRAAGFQLARTNSNGIETWYTTDVAPLSAEQDADIRRRSEVSQRSARIRGRRMQLELGI